MEILVIGNGLAGLSAAIEGAKRGAKVTLVSQNTADRSQSVMAEGGINAALNTKGENDSTVLHGEETLKSACGLASSDAVKQMTEAAPSIIKYLNQIGVVFSRDEQGNADVRAFGGQSKRRTVYAKSGIGRQLVAAMSQEVRKYTAQGFIQLKEHHRFVELILQPAYENASEDSHKLFSNQCGEKCIGAIVQDIHTGRYEAIVADSVVMATGGMNGLFGETTGSYLSDGMATATAFKQGVKLANLEMIQYHPTTMTRGEKRFLISEAARGEGGRLFVYRQKSKEQDAVSLEEKEKWYFMEEMYPERGNLMPRDIVSQTMYKVGKEHGQIYLDLTHIPRQILEIKLKEVCDTCRTFFDIEPSKEYIPVSPGVHYFMGGFYVDEGHRCSMAGLYAAGECASQYHGANRLGGNSTLGAIYGGMKAVESVIADFVDDIHAKKNRTEYAQKYLGRKFTVYDSKAISCGQNIVQNDIVRKLQRLMMNSMGILRNEEVLQESLNELDILNKKVEKTGYSELEKAHIEAFIGLAKATIKSALERKESRGAHIRTDYPNRNDEKYAKVLIAHCDKEGEVSVCAN